MAIMMEEMRKEMSCEVSNNYSFMLPVLVEKKKNQRAHKDDDEARYFDGNGILCVHKIENNKKEEEESDEDDEREEEEEKEKGHVKITLILSCFGGKEMKMYETEITPKNSNATIPFHQFNESNNKLEAILNLLKLSSAPTTTNVSDSGRFFIRIHQEETKKGNSLPLLFFSLLQKFSEEAVKTLWKIPLQPSPSLSSNLSNHNKRQRSASVFPSLLFQLLLKLNQVVQNERQSNAILQSKIFNLTKQVQAYKSTAHALSNEHWIQEKKSIIAHNFILSKAVHESCRNLHATSLRIKNMARAAGHKVSHTNDMPPPPPPPAPILMPNNNATTNAIHTTTRNNNNNNNKRDDENRKDIGDNNDTAPKRKQHAASNETDNGDDSSTTTVGDSASPTPKRKQSNTKRNAIARKEKKKKDNDDDDSSTTTIGESTSPSPKRKRHNQNPVARNKKGDDDDDSSATTVGDNNDKGDANNDNEDDDDDDDDLLKFLPAKKNEKHSRQRKQSVTDTYNKTTRKRQKDRHDEEEEEQAQRRPRRRRRFQRAQRGDDTQPTPRVSARVGEMIDEW